MSLCALCCVVCVHVVFVLRYVCACGWCGGRVRACCVESVRVCVVEGVRCVCVGCHAYVSLGGGSGSVPTLLLRSLCV